MAKTCFVVGPIGEEGSPMRARSDALLGYIIKKVLTAAPFEMAVDRADDIQKPGLITSQVIERIVNADLVVADLTDHNPNAFYELALRHATRKPVVHLILRGQSIPFDIKQQRTIYYDTTDLAIAEKAKEDLRKQAEAALAGADPGDNPISAALMVLDLAKSKSSTDQSLARILNEVTGVKESVRAIEGMVARTTNTGWTPLGTGANTVIGSPTTLPAYLTLDPGVLKAIGGGLLGRLNQPLYVGGAASADKALPNCAICGQPIAGVEGRRSADNAPIHAEGKCPPRVSPPPAKSSSGH